MAPPMPPQVRPPNSNRPVAKNRADAVECPRCGRHMARIIGRSEAVPVVYLRCDGCQMPSVARA
jgi:Zn finger protein HypA/HybF involved in hydrogenase expression